MVEWIWSQPQRCFKAHNVHCNPSSFLLEFPRTSVKVEQMFVKAESSACIQDCLEIPRGSAPREGGAMAGLGTDVPDVACSTDTHGQVAGTYVYTLYSIYIDMYIHCTVYI